MDLDWEIIDYEDFRPSTPETWQEIDFDKRRWNYEEHRPFSFADVAKMNNGKSKKAPARKINKLEKRRLVKSPRGPSFVSSGSNSPTRVALDIGKQMPKRFRKRRVDMNNMKPIKRDNRRR